MRTMLSRARADAERGPQRRSRRGSCESAPPTHRGKEEFDLGVNRRWAIKRHRPLQRTKASVQSWRERPDSASIRPTAWLSVSAATKSITARPRARPTRSGVPSGQLRLGQLDQVADPAGQAVRLVRVGQPGQQRLDQRGQQAGLAALVQGQIGAGQHEAVLDELEDLHLVPLRRRPAGRGRSGPRAGPVTSIESTRRLVQVAEKAATCGLRLERAVERRRPAGRRPARRGPVSTAAGEGVVVGDPGVLAVQLPAQLLDRAAGRGPGRSRRHRRRCQAISSAATAPCCSTPTRWTSSRSWMAYAMSSAVSITEASTVCCQSATRPANGTRAWHACRRPRWSTRRTSANRRPGRPAAAAAPRGGGSMKRGCGSGWVRRVHGYFRIAARVAAVRLRPIVAWPRISVLVTIRYDWALPSKPSRRPQPLPGQLVQHPLAQVPERRVPQIVGEGGRLDHVRVAAAELLQQVGVPGRRPAARRSPGPPGPPSGCA